MPTKLQQSQSDLQKSEERFRAIFDHAANGIGVLDNDSCYLQVNRKLCEMLGYTDDELIGKSLSKITYPVDPEGKFNHGDQLLAGLVDTFPLEKRYIRKNGSIIWVHVSTAVVHGPSGEPIYSISSITDLSERKRLEIFHNVASTLAKSKTITKAMPRIIRIICETLGWDCGAYWKVDKEKQQYYCTETWSLANTQIKKFMTYSSQCVFPIDHEGFIKRTWLSNRPVWISDITTEPISLRASQAAEAKLLSAFAFRILSADKTIGILEFFSRNTQKPDTALHETALSIGVQIGQFIQHKQIEDAQRRSEAQLSGIIQSAMQAIIMVDEEMSIVLFNPAAEKIFGYKSKNVIGTKINRLIPARLMGLRFNGEEFPIEASISHLTLNKKKLYTVILSDLTLSLASEENLHLATEVIKNVQEAIVIIDASKKVISVNPAFTSITGFTEDEAIGKIPRIFNADINNKDSYQTMWSSLKKTGHWYGEVWDQRKNGDFYCQGLSLDTIKNLYGEVGYYAAVFYDITDRKHTEERILNLNTELEQRVMERTRQLQASNKELEAFSYSVSHDLRAPLRGIDGFSQLLLKKYADQLDEAGNNYLQRIRNASERMGDLIDDLLQLSKVSASKIKTKSVDLSQLVHSILRELQENDANRQVELEIQDGVFIDADPRLFRIVLENLVSNAWKFTGKKESTIIRFGIKEQNGEQVVFIKDNGAGFNVKYAHKLFGAFQRLHSVTEFEGTGIGLATVLRIMNLHGGRIWADSTLGEGAAFYFVVPPHR
ncbi:MAG: PAS domain S-box protein [Nitrosomonadaceae bacterium]